MKKNLQVPKKNVPKLSGNNPKNIDSNKLIVKDEDNIHVEQTRINSTPISQPIWAVYAIVFALVFGLYANTIFYGFVFDDPIVITQNQFVKKGLSGLKEIMTTDSFAGIFGAHGGIIAGGRYRPLSLVTFAFEYQIFGENPLVNHIVNLLMYFLTCILLYNILAKLFSQRGFFYSKWLDLGGKVVPEHNLWFTSIPFLATILFAIHPIHTEVIANIKERDDIMALMFMFLALRSAIIYFETQKILHTILCSFYLFLGYMSKENAATFVILIPLILYYFGQQNKTNKRAVQSPGMMKKIIWVAVPLLVSLVVYFLLRKGVLGEAANNNIPYKLMNDPFLEATVGQKYATIFYTLWLYIKLLFYPHPLTVDYYPYHIKLIGWDSLLAILPFITYILLGYWALRGLKNKNIYSFLIWFFLFNLSLYSNLFFPIGTFMTERFLYVGSLSYCILIPYFFYYWVPKNSDTFKWLPYKQPAYSMIVAGVLIIIGLAFSIKTVVRNTAWKDDFTLFNTDLQTSSGSAKSNHVMGELYMMRALELKEAKDSSLRRSLLDSSVKYSQIGVDIHTEYVRCQHNLAAAIYERNNKDYQKAIDHFLLCLKNQPYFDMSFWYLARIFADPQLQITNEYKLKVWQTIYDFQPGGHTKYEVNTNLGTLYLMTNDLDKAQFYLDRCTRLEGVKSAEFNNLAVVFHRKGDFKKAAEMFENAIKLEPNNPQYWGNLGQLYLMMGDKGKADQCFLRLQQLKGGK